MSAWFLIIVSWLVLYLFWRFLNFVADHLSFGMKDPLE